MHIKDADEIENSVDPDQVTPGGTVLSGSMLFGQTYISGTLNT